MEIIAGIVLLSYFLFILLFSWSWVKFPVKKGRNISANKFISVIVPVRNESDNILHLMNDLLLQNIDPAKYEVIIVDDNSQDDTVEKGRWFNNGNKYHFKLL